jgi:dGTPase
VSRELTRRTRENQEAAERLLSPAATQSTSSRGRADSEPPDPMRTPFERDRDRIIHTKAFRRLKHKTQVFINPDGDHFVTRLTHTLQVTQIGRALARYLGLNEPLTEAICLGHDTGHSPFGHTGEEALSPYVEGEWLHSEQSVRVLSVLEPQNLTWEVLDGIRTHSWKIEPGPETPEGMVCRFADRIAYLTHDVEDAIRAGIVTPDDLPSSARANFGTPGRNWINTMINAVVDQSVQAGKVSMHDTLLEPMNELRQFMVERVYLRPEAADQAQHAITVIRGLVDHFAANPDEVPETYRQQDADACRRAVDYVAGMTDRFALRQYERIAAP